MIEYPVLKDIPDFFGFDFRNYEPIEITLNDIRALATKLEENE